MDLVSEIAWVAREARELVTDPAAADRGRRLRYFERKAALLDAIARQSGDPDAADLALRAHRQVEEERAALVAKSGPAGAVDSEQRSRASSPTEE